MVKRDFVYFPDEILFNECSDVDNFGTPELDSLISRMRTACIVEKGVAVAAPQVGSSKNAFYYCMPNGERAAIINPTIHEISDKTVKMTEGCLSIRGYYWEVERPEGVLVSWYNQKGKRFEAAVDGLEGRIFQHEIDHLKGILLLDYLSDEDFDKFEKDFFESGLRGESGPIILNVVE